MPCPIPGALSPSEACQTHCQDLGTPQSFLLFTGCRATEGLSCVRVCVCVCVCVCVWGWCVESLLGPLLSHSSAKFSLPPSSPGAGGGEDLPPPRPLPILGIGLRTMQGDRNNSFFEPGLGHSSPNIGPKPVLGRGPGGGSWGRG